MANHRSICTARRFLSTRTEDQEQHRQREDRRQKGRGGLGNNERHWRLEGPRPGITQMPLKCGCRSSRAIGPRSLQRPMPFIIAQTSRLCCCRPSILRRCCLLASCFRNRCAVQAECGPVVQWTIAARTVLTVLRDQSRLRLHTFAHFALYEGHETTLHRQLKALYSSSAEDRQEVTVDGFRIDAIADDRLIEIQCASLGAIRKKSADFCVLTVSTSSNTHRPQGPCEAGTSGGAVISRRASPRHETSLMSSATSSISPPFSPLPLESGGTAPFHRRTPSATSSTALAREGLPGAGPQARRRGRESDIPYADRPVETAARRAYRAVLDAGSGRDCWCPTLVGAKGRLLPAEGRCCSRDRKRRNSILYQRVPADELAA